MRAAAIFRAVGRVSSVSHIELIRTLFGYCLLALCVLHAQLVRLEFLVLNETVKLCLVAHEMAALLFDLFEKWLSG